MKYTSKLILNWEEYEFAAPSSGTIQTFDFQNDGALWWTSLDLWYGLASIEAWEWFKITRSWNDAMECWIIPPQSIFSGTLKSIKIYRYKPNTTSIYTSRATWIANSDYSTSINWSRAWQNQWALGVNGSTTLTTIDVDWEITTEFIVEDNWHVTFNINWTNDYDIWTYGSFMQDNWENKTLILSIARRSFDVHYIRKVEITTI